jgi:hypothetical protein
MTHTAPTRTQGGTATSTLRAAQALAVLSVLTLLFQFVTAGQLFGPGGEGMEDVHGTGAIVLHVVTGLLTVALLLHQRASRGPAWPVALSAVVFVLTFVQAYFGGGQTLYIHVPGAMILTVGSVWLLAWSFSRAALGRP